MVFCGTQLPDVQDLVLYAMGSKIRGRPVCSKITNVEAMPKVAVAMLSSMTTALFARLGSQMPKCRSLMNGNVSVTLPVVHSQLATGP